MPNDNLSLPMPLKIGHPRLIEVSKDDEGRLAVLRQGIIDASADDSHELYSVILQLAEQFISVLEIIAPHGGLIAKFGRILTFRLMAADNKKRDRRTIERAAAEAMLRILRPELGYTINLADAEEICKQIVGGNYDRSLPKNIIDRVIWILEAGQFREYCDRQGLKDYLDQKLEHILEGYFLLTNRSSLYRTLTPLPRNG